MVAAESGLQNNEQNGSFLDRFSPNQLRWASAAAMLGAVAAAIATGEVWESMEARAAVPQPNVEQLTLPAQPWQSF